MRRAWVVSDAVTLGPFFWNCLAFLRRALTQSSNHAAWGFDRADGEREDYGLDGLLRWTDLTAHRFGCALRGMGRTLNGCRSVCLDERQPQTNRSVSFVFCRLGAMGRTV